MKLALLICLIGGLILAPLAPAMPVPKADDCATVCCKSEGECCETQYPCPIACVVPATGAAVLTSGVGTPTRPKLPGLRALSVDFSAAARSDRPPVPPPRA